MAKEGLSQLIKKSYKARKMAWEGFDNFLKRKSEGKITNLDEEIEELMRLTMESDRLLQEVVKAIRENPELKPFWKEY